MEHDDVVDRALGAIGGQLGADIRDERRRARWTMQRLADEAGVSRSLVGWVESGRVASTETYVRLARALGRRVEMDIVDPRARGPQRAEDPVHAAMGEVLARRLRAHGFEVSLDEPYQHYQFAGRGDLVAWDLGRLAFLHVEHRTRLPNVQEAAGAYNAKRRWLADSLADRLRIRRFRSETHAFVGLWSAEVLHVVRLRHASLAGICPDGLAPLDAWLRGDPPSSGTTSTFALLDPIVTGRSDRRSMVDLGTALRATTRPRYRGYSDALEALHASDLA